MFSKTVEGGSGTAAWRISLWSGLAFAVGTAIAFWFLQNFLANDIQTRGDRWLTGELAVLADVAQRTPSNQLHDAVVDEVAELASREAPHDESTSEPSSPPVFFLQTASDGRLKLHTGAGVGEADGAAVLHSTVLAGAPATVQIPGFRVPFRVVETQLSNGDRIYLGLSTRYERKILHRLRRRFTLLWSSIIVLGTVIVFFSTRRMLYRVQVITETAASVGRRNLSSRVPTLRRNDEIARLSLTLNRMLDRIESSVQQLHAMSDALAHDLRSPITSMRGKLELALMSPRQEERDEAIVHCIDELDRISALLSTSLDVSLASADALRLRKEPIDLEKTLRSMVELYEPSFAHAGLKLRFHGEGPLLVDADTALMQRTVANLLDNEYKHLAPGHTVDITLQSEGEQASILVEDDGAGFPEELLPRIFDRYVKGSASPGHGLGLAFVEAVIRSHDGSVVATNRNGGGASLAIHIPLQDTMALTPVSR